MHTNPGRMPVVFAGHGSPMNAIENNRWSQGFAALATQIPPPKAILAISAHWFVDGTWLTGTTQPPTIHDFRGFPKALFEVEYRAPGQVDLATQVRSLIGEERAGLNTLWGLDHGTWSVLKWMYPDADIPVIQLSIDRRLNARSHYQLARSLAPLRDAGVLVLASGNITHNLPDAFGRMRSADIRTPDWATRFDQTVAAALEQHDTDTLLGLLDSDDGRRAHPTPEHWLPLIYAWGASDQCDIAQFPIEGFDWGSISMRNVVLSPPH